MAQQFSIEVLKNGLAVSGIVYLDIQRMLKHDTNDVLQHTIAMGGLQTAAEYLVNYLDGTLHLDPYKLLDDVTFNSIAYFVLTSVGAPQLAYSWVAALPLPAMVKQIVLAGFMLVVARTAYEYADRTPMIAQNQIYAYTFHPSIWVRQLMNRQ